jgi:hypothetical protein
MKFEKPGDRERLRRDPLFSYRTVAAALREWVERHPQPDEPVRLTLEEKPMSPRQLVVEVEAGSSIGREFVANVLRLAELSPEWPLWEVLDVFRRPGHGKPERPFHLEE